MRKTLRNKEVKELINTINDVYSYTELTKKDKIEIVDNVILINNKSMFFYFEKKIVPTLKLLLQDNFLKKITVDMGAIPYAVKGADMMRPGVVKIDEDIKKSSIVSVIDEKHSKPVMVGIALFETNEMKNMNSGKVVKNIHFIVDEIWNH